TFAEADRLVALLAKDVGVFKVGKQLFLHSGPEVVRMIHRYGVDVFLDLKFHDIPHTVARAGVEAARLGVRFFDLHASGSFEMMERTHAEVTRVCRREAIRRPKILAVTVLTSLGRSELRRVCGADGSPSCALSLPQRARPRLPPDAAASTAAFASSPGPPRAAAPASPSRGAPGGSPRRASRPAARSSRRARRAPGVSGRPLERYQAGERGAQGLHAYRRWCARAAVNGSTLRSASGSSGFPCVKAPMPASMAAKKARSALRRAATNGRASRPLSAAARSASAAA